MTSLTDLIRALAELAANDYLRQQAAPVAASGAKRQNPAPLPSTPKAA